MQNHFTWTNQCTQISNLSSPAEHSELNKSQFILQYALRQAISSISLWGSCWILGQVLTRICRAWNPISAEASLKGLTQFPWGVSSESKNTPVKFTVKVYSCFVLYLHLYQRPILSYRKVKCVWLQEINHRHEYLFCYFKMAVVMRKPAKVTYIMSSEFWIELQIIIAVLGVMHSKCRSF